MRPGGKLSTTKRPARLTLATLPTSESSGVTMSLPEFGGGLVRKHPAAIQASMRDRISSRILMGTVNQRRNDGQLFRTEKAELRNQAERWRQKNGAERDIHVASTPS